MIQRVVAFALRFRAIIIASTLLVIFGGGIAYSELDIEAYPNPCPPLVETLVQPMGWSAEEVERYVTIPMEVGLSGMPGLTYIRSQSLFSLSDVKCYFAWGTDYWADRQEVINRMTTWIQLPNGLQSQISPWNAIGEVFRYTLEGDGYTLTDMKTAEDWIMERQWRQVQGVIDVTSYGGTTKQYHVDVDPYRLRGHGVTLAQTITALQNANQNVGGQRLSIGEQSYDVRGHRSTRLLRNASHRHRRRRRFAGSPGKRPQHRDAGRVSATSRTSPSGTLRASAWSATMTTTTSYRASC